MSLTLVDVNNIEGEAESREDYCKSIQRAINSHAWTLQGSYGRAMMEAIEGGSCMLGTTGCRDYWGNYVPSRFEVKEGTKGSRQFVIDNEGEEWADLMESVGVPEKGGVH